jgi:hypothetical protein
MVFDIAFVFVELGALPKLTQKLIGVLGLVRFVEVAVEVRAASPVTLGLDQVELGVAGRRGDGKLRSGSVGLRRTAVVMTMRDTRLKRRDAI